MSPIAVYTAIFLHPTTSKDQTNVDALHTDMPKATDETKFVHVRQTCGLTLVRP